MSAKEIPPGFCQCGCGGRTTIPKYNDKRLGLIAGVPKKYIRGHAPTNFQKGAAHHRWNDGRTRQGKNQKGYVLISTPNHPRADRDGYVYEHILVMEKLLGRLLLPGETVHHLDGDKANNVPENLLLFPSLAMHTKFHQWLKKQNFAK
jgi:hypothetical protein